MKRLYTLTAFILMSGMVAAQSWNNPSKAFIEKALNGIVLPQIEYEHSSGLEVLEFIRYRVWDAHLFDEEAPRVAFEFRCSPGLLLKEVTFKAKNISCGDALNGVCRKLEITWAIEQGKIVFTDSKKKALKSEQGTAPNRSLPPSQEATSPFSRFGELERSLNQ